MTGEFDNLTDKAEQYTQQHPEQVEKGEDAVEQKLGIGEQDHAGRPTVPAADRLLCISVPGSSGIRFQADDLIGGPDTEVFEKVCLAPGPRD